MESRAEIVKIGEICRVFPGRALAVDLGPIAGGFRDHSGSIWVPKMERMQSRNSNEKSLKKSHASHYEIMQVSGGVPLNNPQSTPGHHDKGPLNTL